MTVLVELAAESGASDAAGGFKIMIEDRGDNGSAPPSRE